MGLHYILQHLDKPGTYVRILFVDFSSAFNTIILDSLLNKLTQLSVPISICQWITSFLTDRQQLVRLESHIQHHQHWCSSGVCVLSPLLFSHGLDHGLQEKPPALPSLTIMNSTETTVESFRFLGSTISQDLKWDNHIDSIEKKAQQRLYFLRRLKKFNLPQVQMTPFYSAVIKSVLCSSITVWFGSASKSDIRILQRTVRTAERIIGVHLPSLQDLYNSRVKKRAGNIITDPSHPGHNLFALLPSGRRYRSIEHLGIKTAFPHAISSLNR